MHLSITHPDNVISRTKCFASVILVSFLMLYGCSGGGSSNATTYSVSGSATGMTDGNALSLLINGAGELRITLNGPFSFPTRLADGATYTVTVGKQPEYQRCTITNSTGTISRADMSDVRVTCVSTPEFVYVANFGTADISAYAVDSPTGNLTAVSGSPFGAAGNPLAIAIDPSGKFAYVTALDNSVLAYTIDATTGALTAVAGSPFAAGHTPIFALIDPTGRYLYVANRDDNTISAYTIDTATGRLSAISGSPFIAGKMPNSLAIDWTGNLAYVTNSGDDTISVYMINQSTGALTAIAGSPFAAGHSPSSVALGPNGKFAYVANSGDGTISTYTVDPATATLTTIAGTTATGGGAISVVLSPDGRYAYVPSIQGYPHSTGVFLLSTIYTFSVAPTSGQLSPATASSLQGVSLTIDPSGRFAYATNNVNVHELYAYTIDANTGAFTPMQNSPFFTGESPHGIAVTHPK